MRRSLLVVVLLTCALLRISGADAQIVLPGTQPGDLVNWPLIQPSNCITCHGDYVAGLDYELLPGRNVVGRHPDCEVVLPGDLRNISRAHLLIERADETTLNLTDLSSKGTFLPADLLVSEQP